RLAIASTARSETGNVLVRSGREAPVSRPSRTQRRISRRWWAAVAIASGAAAAAGLIVGSPWLGAPSIIDQARAAILNPTSGHVLFERGTVRPSGVGHVPNTNAVIHFNVWVDGGSPHHFRLTYDSPVRGIAPGELGGTLGSVSGLSYRPYDDVLI